MRTIKKFHCNVFLGLILVLPLFGITSNVSQGFEGPTEVQGKWIHEPALYELLDVFEYTIRVNGLQVPEKLFLDEGDTVTIDISIFFEQAPLMGVFVRADLLYHYPPEEIPDRVERGDFPYDSYIPASQIAPGRYQIVVNTAGFQGGDYSLEVSMYKEGFQEVDSLPLFDFNVNASLATKLTNFGKTFAVIAIQLAIVLLILYGAYKIFSFMRSPD